jgi:hypothetical protein
MKGRMARLSSICIRNTFFDKLYVKCSVQCIVSQSLTSCSMCNAIIFFTMHVCIGSELRTLRIIITYSESQKKTFGILVYLAKYTFEVW